VYEAALPFRGAPVCGEVVAVNDASIGEAFRARLAGWSLSAQVAEDGQVSVDQTIRLERFDVV
jgi:hypothetical protein